MVETTVDKVYIDLEVRTQGTDKIDLIAKNVRTFNGVMASSDQSLNKFVKSGGKFNTWQANFALGIKKATTGLHSFRMEFLSVMFFGMEMSNVFGKWAQNALDLTGATELLNTALNVTVLSSDSFWMLNDAITSFSLWLFEADDSTKNLIGSFIVFNQVAGNVLFFLGSMILGFGGLVEAFGPGLTTVLGTAGMSALMGVFANLLGISLDSAQDLVLTLGAGFAGYKLLIPGITSVVDTLTKIGRSKIKPEIGLIWDSFKTGVGDAFSYLAKNLIAPAAKIALKVEKVFEGATKLIDSALTGLFGTKGAGWIMATAGAGLVIYSALKLIDAKPGDKLTIDYIVSQLLSGLGLTTGAMILAKGLKFSQPVAFAISVGLILTDFAIDFGFAKAVENTWNKVINLPIFRSIINWFNNIGGKFSIDISTGNMKGGVQESFATGGIVFEPTRALVGEAGPEAIIPLSKFDEVINNTNNSSNINVYANVSNNYDVRQLADELSQYMGLNVNRSAYL